MRPTGVDELKYNNGTITAKITDPAICADVKNKLGDKVTGECSALIVTLDKSKVQTEPLDEEFNNCLDSSGKASREGYPNALKRYFDQRHDCTCCQCITDFGLPFEDPGICVTYGACK